MRGMTLRPSGSKRLQMITNPEKNMSYIGKQSFVGVLFLSAFALALPAPAQTKGDKPAAKAAGDEAAFIEKLAPSNSESNIVNAIGKLEQLYKKDVSKTNGIPALKKLVPDSREAVRRKAARVLGIFHAPMDDADIRQVCQLLKAGDWREIVDGLKTLRGLNAPQAVPDILPLLKHPQANVVRDACRTLAVLGSKDVIASIEPLKTDKNPAIQKDANDAIALLRAKP